MGAGAGNIKFTLWETLLIKMKTICYGKLMTIIKKKKNINKNLFKQLTKKY